MSEFPKSASGHATSAPWVRNARPGHLGPHPAKYWTEMAHSEAAVACHKTILTVGEDGQGDWQDPAIRQCAGMAIFRSNVWKSPRHPEIVTLPRDDEPVFSWDDEFIEHHEG